MSEQDPMWPHKVPIPSQPLASNMPNPREEKRQEEPAVQENHQTTQENDDLQAEVPPYMEGPRMRMGQGAQATMDRRLAHPVDGGFLSTILGNDPATRKLMGGALALVILLLLIVGTWTILRGRPKEIPIIAPPSLPLKQRPSDPGGMQIMSDDLTHDPDISGKGSVHLAPPPEQPDTRMLSRDNNASNIVNHAEQPVEQSQEAALPKTQPFMQHPNNGGVKSDMLSSLAKNTQKESPETEPTDQKSGQEADQDDQEEAPPAAKPVKTTQAHHGNVKDDKEKKSGKSVKSSKIAETHGHYQVQLAALDSESLAKKEWVYLQHKAPDILGHHNPAYTKIERNGRHFVRLRVGGFADGVEAKHFCAKLHARSIACTPASF